MNKNKRNNFAPKNMPKSKTDKIIPGDIYPQIDTDLARDNLENDIPSADLQDLQRD